MTGNKFLFGLFIRLNNIVEKILSWHYRGLLNYVGENVVLRRGLTINHPECVSIGSNSFLNERCWISILKDNVEKDGQTISLDPHVRIGENTYVGRFCTIACMNKVEIGNNVLISDRVYLGDCLHGYERLDLPIKDQYMVSSGPVIIEDDTWIGINVSILPNVMIGKHCIIGANSVVTENIPAYHIAAGSPARIIKRIIGA